MNTALKVISLLLAYPTQEIKQGAADLATALEQDKALAARSRDLLLRVVRELEEKDLYDLQERYVFLFDRTRTLSLHLFEHVHGESRDRGQAMVDLMATYEAGGFEIGTKELPDYLPLFLEYLAHRPVEEAAELLGQTAHILTALKERLKKRSSVYANVFAALEEMASGKADTTLLSSLLGVKEDDPEDLESLDQIWEEEVVKFGGNAGEQSCGPDRLQRRIRADNRKPDDLSAHQTL